MTHREVPVTSDSWQALAVDIDQLRSALTRLSLSLKDLLFETRNLQQRVDVDRVANELIQRVSRQTTVAEENHPPK